MVKYEVWIFSSYKSTDIRVGEYNTKKEALKVIEVIRRKGDVTATLKEVSI